MLVGILAATLDKAQLCDRLRPSRAILAQGAVAFEPMTNVHPLLPRLVLNRRFVHELMSMDEACCALGLVEERKRLVGLLALTRL